MFPWTRTVWTDPGQKHYEKVRDNKIKIKDLHPLVEEYKEGEHREGPVTGPR